MRSALSKTALGILKVLETHQDIIIGSRELSKQLRVHGIELTERTIRYHMKILDEKGLTQVFGKEGRKITKLGLDELSRSHVSDKVGFINSKIDNLAFKTSFDPETLEGELILNISLFDQSNSKEAMKIMKKVFASPFVMSDKVIIAPAGQRIGDYEIPEGKIGIGTVCSVTISGVFLKYGIPINSRYGGLVEVRDEDPSRFVALISYEGTSLDPHLIFIKSRMTSVLDVVKHGHGNILASYRDIPVQAIALAIDVQEKLNKIGMGGVMAIGNPNQPLMEVPTGLDKTGMVVVGGLNPIAALEEGGIDTYSTAMSVMVKYNELRPFSEWK